MSETLRVSFGYPVQVAESLHRPIHTAELKISVPEDGTQIETWEVNGSTFNTLRDERMRRALSGEPIGCVDVKGEEVGVYQAKPPKVLSRSVTV